MVAPASTVTTDDGAVGAPVGLLGTGGSCPGVPGLVDGPAVTTLVGGEAVVELGMLVTATVVSLTSVVVVVGKYSGWSNPRMIPRPGICATRSAYTIRLST